VSASCVVGAESRAPPGNERNRWSCRGCGGVPMVRGREGSRRGARHDVLGGWRWTRTSSRGDCLALLNGWLEPSWFTLMGSVMPSQTGCVDTQHGSSMGRIGQLAHASRTVSPYAICVIREVNLM
jgi:hypothetical protein